MFSMSLCILLCILDIFFAVIGSEPVEKVAEGRIKQKIWDVWEWNGSVCVFVTLLSHISLLCILRLWNILQNRGLLWFPTVFVILSDLLTKIKYLSSLTVFWNANFFGNVANHTLAMCAYVLYPDWKYHADGAGEKKYIFSMLLYASLLWKTMYETYTLPLKGAKLTLLDNPYGKHFEIVFQGILPLPHCFLQSQTCCCISYLVSAAAGGVYGHSLHIAPSDGSNSSPC